MTIPELNNYLRNNIRSSFGDFLNSKPYEDEYECFRRDAEIYCHSSALSILNKTSTSNNYASYILDMVKQTIIDWEPVIHRNEILILAYQSVKADGDDLCDEQSVGWYIGLYTYVHCLAFNTYDYKEIFVENWKRYFSVLFQHSIRNIKSNSDKRMISMEEVIEFIHLTENYGREILDLKFELMRVHCYSYYSKEDFENALCKEAHKMYLLKQDKNYLFCLMQAVTVLYYENTDEMHNVNGLCIIANKILNGCE